MPISSSSTIAKTPENRTACRSASCRSAASGCVLDSRERFRLKTHVEPRQALYELVLARGEGRLGPELKPSRSDCSNTDELNAKRADAVAKGDLASIVPKPGEFLSCAVAPNLANGPAKTGLTGRYDFDMKLDMQALMGLVHKMGINVPSAAMANLPQADGSSMMTALNEQLGLKFQSSRGPVDVLVVDSVEAPTAD